MKFLLTLVIAACAGCSEAYSRNLRVREERGLLAVYGEPGLTGCLETGLGQATDGNWFVLGDCSNRNNGVRKVDRSYVEDNQVMFELRDDDRKCMQASHGEEAKHGSWMRVYPCDDTNPLQLFEYIPGGNLKLWNTNLCVVYRGTRAQVNQDPIILRDCDSDPNAWSNEDI